MLKSVLLAAALSWGLQAQHPNPANTTKKGNGKVEQVVKSEEQWKKELTAEQYRVLRQKGTERAYTGKYWDHKEEGVYVCAACGTELFTSTTKFDSHCGWPSFYKGVDKSRIKETDDYSMAGIHRIEVTCAKCGGHLGHVFPDGPEPTGLRYCINSASLGFHKKGEDKPKK